MRNILIAVLLVSACSGGVDDVADVDALPADGGSCDAAVRACDPMSDRAAACAAACDPFAPSEMCGGTTVADCVAECRSCVAAGVAWCPR